MFCSTYTVNHKKRVGIHHQPVAAHPDINTLDARDEALYSSWCGCCCNTRIASAYDCAVKPALAMTSKSSEVYKINSNGPNIEPVVRQGSAQSTEPQHNSPWRNNWIHVSATPQMPLKDYRSRSTRISWSTQSNLALRSKSPSNVTSWWSVVAWTGHLTRTAIASSPWNDDVTPTENVTTGGSLVDATNYSACNSCLNDLRENITDWTPVDPSAAPPSVFRLARTKSGWRADPRRPKFGWRRRQTFPAAAAAAEFGASS